jgi:hypothetical protein
VVTARLDVNVYGLSTRVHVVVPETKLPGLVE